MRICFQCGDSKIESAFRENRNKCKVCELQYSNQWNKSNRDRLNSKSKLRRKKMKNEVIAHNSNCKMICACCGENEFNLLCIDHIHNDGAEERKKIGTNDSTTFYKWLKDLFYPYGYQVLCYGCNLAKYRLGEKFAAWAEKKKPIKPRVHILEPGLCSGLI